jgi:hypothetical protein
MSSSFGLLKKMKKFPKQTPEQFKGLGVNPLSAKN